MQPRPGIRPRVVDIYQIDENGFGEFLIATPALGAHAETSLFELAGDTLAIYYDDGEIVRLPGIPHSLRPKLARARTLTLVEIEGETPRNCHVSERAQA